MEEKQENITMQTNEKNVEIEREKKVEKNSHNSLVWKKVLDYIIKTMNGMALGLFSTLIIGTIIATVAGFFNEGTKANILLNSLASLFKNLTGAGIGIGIAWSLKYEGIKLIAISISGAVASYFCYSTGSVDDYIFKVGDPLSIYLVVIITSILFNQIFKKKTPVDIIIVPLFTSLISAAITLLISKYVVMITTSIGSFVGVATEYQPLIMGIVISVVMGMALTAPISSAAIAAVIFTEVAIAENAYVAIAGGAALIGCCTQMVGFAVMSRKDNNIGTVFAIGIGTSMLQFKNILKKPVIWLPTIIVSAILGPISTVVLKMICSGTACGMGTSGLVGQVGTIASMGGDIDTWLIIIGFQILLPLVLVWGIDIIFRKKNWIKDGDLKI